MPTLKIIRKSSLINPNPSKRSRNAIQFTFESDSTGSFMVERPFLGGLGFIDKNTQIGCIFTPIHLYPYF